MSSSTETVGQILEKYMRNSAPRCPTVFTDQNRLKQVVSDELFRQSKRAYLVMRDSNRSLASTIEYTGLPIQRDHIISDLDSSGPVDCNGVTFERKAHLGIWLFRIAARTSGEGSAQTTLYARTGWYCYRKWTVPQWKPIQAPTESCRRYRRKLRWTRMY